jgi:hypothetical protein
VLEFVELVVQVAEPAAAGDRLVQDRAPGHLADVLARRGRHGRGLRGAEQSEPIRRRVALKVIKQGMDTARVVARFDAERQALALMDHPCIAKVLRRRRHRARRALLRHGVRRGRADHRLLQPRSS